MKKTPKTYSRREVVKLLALSSLSLYTLSCVDDKKASEEKAPPELEPVPEKTDLEKILESKNVLFIKPGEQQYDKLRQGFNKGIDKKPAIIALPNNTKGVADAVKYANIKNLKVAIKSGGHSLEGFSVNEGGMVINLSLLNKIESIDDNHVKLGPGVKLKELYSFLLPKKRILPAGSCATVGVGGLALGGGYGFFARKYGLTCDQLQRLKLVDGQGNIHDTKDDPNLLWAAKGGGNGNFGVVTEMEFKTYKAPNGFQQYRLKAYKLDKDRAKTIMQKWFELSAKLPNSCFSAFILNHRTIVILITNYESCKCETLHEMITELEKIMDKTYKGKMMDLAKSLKRYYGIQHPVYFQNSSGGFYKGFETIEGCIDGIIEKVLSTSNMIYQVNTMGGAINSQELEKKSCYPHRSYSYLCEIQTYWEKPKQAKRLKTAFSEVLKIIENHGIDAHYRNYPCTQIKNWEEKYYGKENYKKLQQIKKELDPNNVIQHPQSIKA